MKNLIILILILLIVPVILYFTVPEVKTFIDAAIKQGEKGGSTGGGSGSGGGSGNTIPEPTPSNEMTPGAMVGDDIKSRSGGVYAIDIKKNRQPEGYIKPGDTVRVTGDVPFTGRYVVDKVWIDSNGNIGSVYIPLLGYFSTNTAGNGQYSEKFTIVKATSPGVTVEKTSRVSLVNMVNIVEDGVGYPSTRVFLFPSINIDEGEKVYIKGIAPTDLGSKTGLYEAKYVLKNQQGQTVAVDVKNLQLTQNQLPDASWNEKLQIAKTKQTS